jgi:hypothetical protein
MDLGSREGWLAAEKEIVKGLEKLLQEIES